MELVRVCVSNGADLIRLVEYVEEKIVLGGQLRCRPLRATGSAAALEKNAINCQCWQKLWIASDEFGQRQIVGRQTDVREVCVGVRRP